MNLVPAHGGRSAASGASSSLPDIDGHRLLTRIRELARIGADSRGGVTRPGFSAADRQGIAYVTEQARQAGLVATVDQAGNLVVRQPDSAPGRRQALLMGSHLDTVIHGGALDGAYGVLAALEVLQSLGDHGARMRYEPVVIAFANEEGALFPCPFWGSLAVTGELQYTPDELLDRSGGSLREPLRAVGGDPDAVTAAQWATGSIGAYLELHIEQGPVLERGGDQIGVVEGITCRTVITVAVHGEAGHAGTVPMDLRADALAAASRVVLAAEDVARRGLCTVATVGRFQVDPDVTNVIPGVVRLTVDLRDLSETRLQEAERAFADELAKVGARTGTRIEASVTDRYPGSIADRGLRAAIGDAADDLGLSRTDLPSGAGHDAQIIASVAPVGMLFVPSRGGSSHVPEESTGDDDLVAGARVLLRTAVRVGELDQAF
ncbi:Zn-dependent hydrolase [Actinophytocola glycyrrhizae]|uniref:Zn-dependent hydrolase n=1 Tax=Actinophytocola glycyrrhizae TaxID=2044873 RepID=A0ABV9S5F8_9PSEU